MLGQADERSSACPRLEHSPLQRHMGCGRNLLKVNPSVNLYIDALRGLTFRRFRSTLQHLHLIADLVKIIFFA